MLEKSILIIKLGAMGDVLRTTPLLHVLGGDIYWVTKKENIPLLPNSRHILKQIIDINNVEGALDNINFDLVISLDDDLAAASLASTVNKSMLIGSFLSPSGEVSYTDTAADWFDMGLISKFGKERADDLKKKNTRTYQEIIFSMVGRQFKGEEYIINYSSSATYKNRDRIMIGIERRSDMRWPTKIWNKFDKLSKILCSKGYEIKFFQQRDTVLEHLNDIDECDLIVTGDTLAMHIALALRIKVVAIFTCTSPAEIYDYGRLTKIVSPLLEKAFYREEYIHDAVDAISLDTVYKSIQTIV